MDSARDYESQYSSGPALIYPLPQFRLSFFFLLNFYYFLKDFHSEENKMVSANSAVTK